MDREGRLFGRHAQSEAKYDSWKGRPSNPVRMLPVPLGIKRLHQSEESMVLAEYVLRIGYESRGSRLGRSISRPVRLEE